MDPFIAQIQFIGTIGQVLQARPASAQVRKDSADAHLDYLQITLEN